MRYQKEFYHHGILGQKWGVKNGPPYPLSGGDYTSSEKKAIKKRRFMFRNSIYNKKHFDEVLKKDKTSLTTLSYDPNRTKDSDMFYATHNVLDKHQYNALFNSPIKKELYDHKGRPIGTGSFLKYRINNSIKNDIKVASEDSGSDLFVKLYKKDRDFYNFITDSKRMESYFVEDKYKFKGYRESKKAIDKLKKPGYIPSENEVKSIYRMFNYVIPYDGAGDVRSGHDVAVQRAKFFKMAKEAGYGALLDTNDAIYGGFKARSPVIVFDMDKIVFKNIKMTKASSKKFSALVLAGRKILGV